MNPQATFVSMEALRRTLAGIGAPFELLLLAASLALAVFAVLPTLWRWRGWVLAGTAALLVIGEGVLVWFHWRLYTLTTVIDPLTGAMTGRVAVPLWVESEKLYVWALVLAILGVVMRRHREDLLSGTMLVTAVLTASAALLGNPFTKALPSFFGQYYGYLQAMFVGGQSAVGAFEGLEAARQFYYNAWYMWVHPPLLFFSYGCFAISFVATLRMIASHHSSFETTAYRWARLGYLSLTLGMLLGFPWALSAWQGQAWWWSGKVNMSLMMWLLYTAVLHARLYLRRNGMWRAVALLGVLAFTILVLTYITTYVVPGAHSYALAPDSLRAVALLMTGGAG